MKRHLVHIGLSITFMAVFALFGSVKAEEIYTFSDGKIPDGWTVGSGEWKVVDGALVVDASGSLATIFFGDPHQQNYELSAKITYKSVDDALRWASLIFRAGEDGKRPWSQVPVRFETTARNGIEFAVLTDKGWNLRQANNAKEPCKLGETRELRVLVRGTMVEAYLDGVRLIRNAFCIDRDYGCVGLAASGCSVAFDDVTVKPLPPSESTFSEMKPKPCKVIAHRGFSGIAPENTLASARAAIDVGADGSEFDIRCSSDGHIILLHDYTVDRTTDGKGKGSELTFATLRKLDAGSWKDKKYAGEQIPTLDEAIAVFKDTGCKPVIEIKEEGISQRVIDAVRRAGMFDQTIIIAGSGKVVREIRKLAPELPCYLVWRKVLEGTPHEQAQEILRVAAKHNTSMVDLDYGMLSPEVVKELKRGGLTVWCWTVDSPVAIEALMRWGVDGITTNYPNEVIHLLNKIEGK